MEKQIQQTMKFKASESNPNEFERVIEKPITLIVEDFRNELVNVINESHLPFFVIEGVVEKLLTNIKNASVQQLEADKISYLNQLKEVENQPIEKSE